MSQMTEATTPQGENTTQSSKIPTPLAEIEINSGVGDIITQLGHTSSHLVEISTQAGGSTSSLGETTSRTSGLQGRPTQPATSSDVGADVSGDHEVTNNNNGETTREEPGESSEHYMTTSDLGGTDVSDNTDKLGEHTTTNPAIIDSSGLTMDNVDGSSGEGIWQSETAQQTDVTKGIGHSSSAKEDDGSEGMELSSTKESGPASIISSTDGVGGSLGLGVSGPEDADIGGGIANDLAVTDATIADVPAVSNAQNTSPEFGDESSSSQSATSSHSGPLGGNSDDSSGSVGTTRSSSQAAMSGIEGFSTSKEVEVNPATTGRAEESATSTKPSASSLLPSEAPQSSGQSQATTISSASDEEEISASAKSATTMSFGDANTSSHTESELQSTTQTDEQVSGSSLGLSTQVSGHLVVSSTAPSNNFSPNEIDSSSGNIENSIASFGSYADSTKAETIKSEDKTEPGNATVSSNHNNATTEPVEQTRTTTARIDHETTSGEADIVINLKTVGLNIISSSVEEGGDDLTTRQLTFYTGSTKDNVIPDQTRHNDLQDKTTQTTKTLDTLTQDSTKTNDDEMQTTTDDKQAPAELNSSVLPSSETDVNTISNDQGGTKEPLSTQLAEQTMTSTVEEIEATKASQGPTNPAWTDTTIDPAIDLNGDLATPEPDKEQNNNLVHDLTHASSTSSSSSTTPCVCPSTTTSLGATDGSTTTTTGTTTASGECLCPDIFGPAEVETATDLPATSGGRRRREWEEDDLFVDDFDQKY